MNFADILGRLGIYPDLPPMPVVVGYEVAGRVDRVGKDVASNWEGRDVLALTHFGGYSDVVCVRPRQVAERPEGMSAEVGAALPVNYLTAYQLVCVMGGLRDGETVLVHSAGGGVGIAAVQLALHVGARVIGTASRGKHEFLKELGVEHCIDYRTEDFERRVKEISGRGRRVGAGRGRRCIVQEELSLPCPHGALGDVRHIVRGYWKTEKLGSLFQDGGYDALATVHAAGTDEPE